MKKNLTLFALLLPFFLTAQLSLDGGLTLPLGDYADDDGGSAGIGFRLSLNYEKDFNETVGLSTKLFYGFNTFEEDTPNIDAGNWTTAGLGAGIYVNASDQLRFYGLALLGSASTPEIESGNVVLVTSANSSALGFEIGGKYYLSNLYLTASYTSFTPEFEFSDGFTTIQEDQVIGFFSLGIGYTFGSN